MCAQGPDCPNRPTCLFSFIAPCTALASIAAMIRLQERLWHAHRSPEGIAMAAVCGLYRCIFAAPTRQPLVFDVLLLLFLPCSAATSTGVDFSAAAAMYGVYVCVCVCVWIVTCRLK